MRAPWDHLHQALIRSLTTAASREYYHQLRADEVVLARFASSDALLTWLTRFRGQLDETDLLYAALVRAAQGSVHTAQVAHTLLMCGLWPGLDRFYRRRVGRFHDDPRELATAISGTFTLLVAGLDLRGVHRVAATLVRSTGREVTSAWVRARADQARQADGAPVRGAEPDDGMRAFETRDEEASAAITPGDAAPVPLALVIDRQRTDEAFRLELDRLHRTLHPVLQEDTELVLRVLVLEEREYQVAARLGMALGAARKRFQRARRRLRAHLEQGEAGHPRAPGPPRRPPRRN